MYGNFIYFILVLLIYTTHYPPENPPLAPVEAAAGFLAGVFVLAITTRVAFDVLARRIVVRGTPGLHGEFDRLFNRQAIVAIIIFAIDIYVLNLKSYFVKTPLFSGSPTITALLFIGIFTVYLSIIWTWAYGPYKVLFQSRLTRRSYVISNVLFSLPVILPWFLISLGVDLINMLPFQGPRRLLATPEGQLVFFSLFLGAVVVAAPYLIKFFWRCRPLSKGPRRTQIEAICHRAALQYRDILDWPIFEGKLMTAGVMGLVKRFRYILVTESLLQVLDDDEIEAVMAHEIGHVKKKHLLFYLVFFLGFIVLSYAIFDLILYAILYGNLWLPVLREGNFEQVTFVSILLTITFATILLIYFRYVFGYFMRNCERQADLHAFRLLGNSRALVSSLNKIGVYSGQSHDRPSWHHFSIHQRIDFLNRCEADKRLIECHDRKLRASIMVFLAALAVTGYAGYAMNFGEMGEAVNKRFLRQALVMELERNPGDHRLYSMLGAIYYEEKSYLEAIRAYEKSLELGPQAPETLNNLAWLYATCEQAGLRRPEKALALARYAAAMKSVPHILDTLAESYYANGFYNEAVETIKRVLVMQPEDRAYYESQLKKFKGAAAGETTR